MELRQCGRRANQKWPTCVCVNNSRTNVTCMLVQVGRNYCLFYAEEFTLANLSK